MKNKRFSLILVAIAAILLLPWVGMQISDETNWTTLDFIIAGSLLLATGISCELILRKAKYTKRKLAGCVLVLLLFMLIWAELAVGLF